MIGKTILHYKILSKLGEGGMGVVYKAEDTKIKREVAIKFLPRQIAASDEERERFKIEAQAAGALNHSNIATIHAIEESDDETFIVMEYIKGQELKDKIDAGPLPIDNALNIAIQIAQGLQAAHEEGVVHRDIKSANIMLTHKGDVKIMDFGLAKRGGEAKLTKDGTTLGTVAYMSPEQTQGSEVDHRSDIFSLGVLVYEMLTGQLPFKGEYDQAVSYAILNEEPEPVTGLRSGIPMELERIVHKCLRKDAAVRYQQANELIADLLQLKMESGTHKSQANSRAAVVGRNRPYGRMALSLLAVVVVFTIYRLFGQGSSTSNDTTESFHPQSIAVLPFENLSSEPDAEPFVRGIHRDLSTQLSRISSLRVTPLRSVRQYGESEKSAAMIAEELKVAAILEGSIQRVGDRVRINVSLIDPVKDVETWTSSFDRQLTMQNILAIQAEVARKIASSLEIRLTDDEQGKIQSGLTGSLQAYDLYQKARFQWDLMTPGSMKQAIRYFEQAIEHDPTFAAAYAGIADTYLGMEFSGILPVDEASQAAREAIEKSLQLDPGLSQSRSALGHVFLHEMSGPSAEREWLHAIELNPRFAEPYGFLAMLLLDADRVDEALEFAAKSIDLDPKAPLSVWAEALAQMARGDFNPAIERYMGLLQQTGGLWVGHYELAWLYPGDGRFELAVQAMKQASFNQPEELFHYHGMRPMTVAIQAADGDEEKARQFLRDHKSGSERPFFLGIVHAALGDLDRAFEIWLNETKWTILLPTHFRHSPLLDSVRSDPRYPQVLAEIKRQWGW